MKKTVTILALAWLVAPAGAMPVTVNVPDGSLTSTPGTYGLQETFFDTVASSESPDRWNVLASDLIIEGEINISDINHKARWNTWDGDWTDGVDKLGAWYQFGIHCGYDGSGYRRGVFTGVPQWTGGGDAANDIRHIFHLQDVGGTQPHPKYYTGPYTDPAWAWLDDWFSFKVAIHATGANCGEAQLWINGDLVSGQGQVPQPPGDTFYFDIADADDGLGYARAWMRVINGDNPNNPAYTYAWRNVTVTGTPVPPPIPEPVTVLGVLAGAAGLGRYLRRRRQPATEG
jgi:hypothetical protein